MTRQTNHFVIVCLFACILLAGAISGQNTLPPSGSTKDPTISGTCLIRHDFSLTTANASFFGETVGDRAGFRVAGVGDVNGDGFDDILVGAKYSCDGGWNSGKIHLILSNATIGNGCANDMNLSTADAAFFGEKPGEWLGDAMARAGDVNGDGFDDILVGAPSHYSSKGKVYLILGNATIGDGCAKNVSIGVANVTFMGEVGSDESGYSVAGAGDVNGDGFDDILIGAPYNDDGAGNAGQTYLILGNATIGNGCAKNMSLGAADASFIGEAASDWAGYSVAGAGDVNGDGYDDFLIGAHENGESGVEAGQAYLVLGNATIGNGCAKDMRLGAADASFIGEATQDWAGCVVAGAGDVNGDGCDDILIGAKQNCERGYHAGQGYLILGNATIGNGCAKDMNLGAASASFLGEWGYSLGNVAGAGDVDNDGYDDILIGANNTAHIILGNGTIGNGCAKDMPIGAADATFPAQVENDATGGSVAGAGNVNGDGLDDFLIGAEYNNEGGFDTGQAYLILGWAIKRPAVIQDLALASPTLDGFVLSWTAPGEDGFTGTVTGYLVKYSTNPITYANFDAAATYAQAWTDLASGGTREERNITGLNERTRYYFAIKAYDVEGFVSVSISNVATGSTLAREDWGVVLIIVAGIAVAAGIIGVILKWRLHKTPREMGKAPEVDRSPAPAIPAPDGKPDPK